MGRPKKVETFFTEDAFKAKIREALTTHDQHDHPAFNQSSNAQINAATKFWFPCLREAVQIGVKKGESTKTIIDAVKRLTSNAITECQVCITLDLTGY
jgi:hypothetical protein